MKLSISFVIVMIILNSMVNCISVDESDSNEENLWQEQDYDPEFNEKNKKKSSWDWLF